jgi:TonB-dependent SusC/RagA subfamily outer membrane receptor
MKNVKLISLVLSMLIHFVSYAQEKSKDTIAAVKIPSNFVQTSIPIKIVCAKSISNVEDPLTILDGIIIDAKQFSKVNPNDIESIKVLKGIEATSIYGSRGINGVIIITSKRKQ